MYNGIGLSTPRGSGTNGYVIRNVSHLKVKRSYPKGTTRETTTDETQFNPLAHLGKERDLNSSKPPNAELLLHERKRQIEVRLLTWQDELEEQGLDTSVIQDKVEQRRTQLLAELSLEEQQQQQQPSEGQSTPEVNLDVTQDALTKDVRAFETHKLAAAKQVENRRMKRALGLERHGHDHYHPLSAEERQDGIDKRKNSSQSPSRHRHHQRKHRRRHRARSSSRD
ncbi:RNA-splicing factor [Dispira simplex]|nr:RNA-splicing factor [Dispira simplex]